MSSTDLSISKKKPLFKVNTDLDEYLKKYGRFVKLPSSYRDLLNFTESFPQKDKYNEYTLWETVLYPQAEIEQLYEGLCYIYALLKTDGNLSVIEHLAVSRIDFCTFGNTKPFRIRIVNKFNDNFDYFYVKQTDASRVFGLELEHLLSPNRINFLVDGHTLIEEHVVGIPGDAFIKHQLNGETINKVRIAKEFVKFNERCFVQLLGDMRAYNYVVDVTPDFEDEQYRIRAIDFDQQCYEGRKSMYLPQYFKENKALVELCTSILNPETVKQYQYEERTLIGKRLYSDRYRIKDVMDCLDQAELSSKEKIEELANHLAKHHSHERFKKMTSMGQLLKLHLKHLLWKPKLQPN